MKFTLWGAVFAFLSVILGAFAAHVLNGHISTEQMNVFQTGVQYQMFHAIALIGVGILVHLGFNGKFMHAAGWLFIVGIILFSGSLYALSMMRMTTIGFLTPLGGFSFLIGWICFVVAVASSKRKLNL